METLTLIEKRVSERRSAFAARRLVALSVVTFWLVVLWVVI